MSNSNYSVLIIKDIFNNVINIWCSFMEVLPDAVEQSRCL